MQSALQLSLLPQDLPPLVTDNILYGLEEVVAGLAEPLNVDPPGRVMAVCCSEKERSANA